MFYLFAPQADFILSPTLDALDRITYTALNTVDQPREVADKLSGFVDGPVPATYTHKMTPSHRYATTGFPATCANTVTIAG